MTVENAMIWIMNKLLTIDFDGVGVFRFVGREADVDLVVVHDLADRAALGSDQTREHAVIDVHDLRHTILLQTAHTPLISRHR